jgi:hypothetical protein
VAIGDQNFERMLDRAWRSLYDAILMAESQGRTYHTRKLKRAALIVTETQQDLTATSTSLSRTRSRRGGRGHANGAESILD